MIETFSLKQFGIMQGYARVEKLGDRLEAVNGLLTGIVFVFSSLRRQQVREGRPMIKCLCLRCWFFRGFTRFLMRNWSIRLLIGCHFRGFKISQCDPGLLDGFGVFEERSQMVTELI